MIILKSLLLSLVDVKNKNKFTGGLPKNFGKLVNLEKLQITGGLISGAIPDISGLNSLNDCAFLPTGMCRDNGWKAPTGSTCDFNDIPLCSKVDDGVDIAGDIARAAAQIESTKPGNEFPLPLIIGISVAAATAVIVIVLSFVHHFMYVRKRKRGGYSRYEESSGATPSEDGRHREVSFLEGVSRGLSIAPIIKLKRKPTQTNYTGAVFDAKGPDTEKLTMVSKIGKGAFGQVWLAMQDEEQVAVKTIGVYNDTLKNLKLMETLFDEARAMIDLRHARIVNCIGVRFKPLSIIMEYLPEGTLSTFIRKRVEIEDWGVRYQMMVDICEGMEFLHAAINCIGGTSKKECFHQDLKTENVLLAGENGKLRAKIADFGLSLTRDAVEKDCTDSDPNKVKHNGGTRCYLAPVSLHITLIYRNYSRLMPSSQRRQMSLLPGLSF